MLTLGSDLEAMRFSLLTLLTSMQLKANPKFMIYTSVWL